MTAAKPNRVCPVHHCDLVPTTDPAWRGQLLLCPHRGCQTVHHIPKTTRQRKLPGLDPGPQHQTIRASEAALVRQWGQWASLHGYEVLELGQHIHYITCPSCRAKLRRIQCPSCDTIFQPTLPSQNTPGTPDTFWSHPAWPRLILPNQIPPSLWVGIEAKKDEHAAVRTEQQRLASLKLIDIVWSLEMLQTALRHR